MGGVTITRRGIRQGAALAVLAGGLAACSGGGGDSGGGGGNGAAAASDVPLAGAIAAQNAICRPALTVDGQTYEAGTAFVVDGARPLLVTAQHLFGEMGGLPEEVSWQDMPRRATAVRCQPGRGATWTTGAALAIDGAHPLSATSTAEYRDIAAFPLTGTAAGTGAPRLTLAAREPATGSRVWLVAQLRGGDPAALLHRATVIGHEQGAMVYAFDDTRIELQATSGAPIVDAEGRLVGINLGGTTAEGSQDVQGVGDGLEVIRKALATVQGG